MGSGKSTFGKKLAKKLNLNFIDLDQYIESKVGLSIPEIFEERGEEKFREIETSSLQQVLNQEGVIISLGGGTPCFGDNIELINKDSVSIYLNLPPKALYSRLINARASRPLIADKTEEELLEFIENHLAEREPFYNLAQVHYNPLQDTEELLLYKLANYSK